MINLNTRLVDVKRLGFALLLFVVAAGVSELRAQETTQFQDWVGVCNDLEEGRRCEIRQVLNIETAEGAGTILTASIARSEGRLLMQLLLPLGVDVRPGVVMAVDEGEERRAPFLTCIQSGCLSIFEVTDEWSAELRRGQVAKVGFRPFNTDQTLVLELSLLGITRALQSIP